MSNRNIQIRNLQRQIRRRAIKAEAVPSQSRTAAASITSPCQHEWVVVSTALQEGWLMVQCVDCGLHGTVNDPTADEWSRAFHAPSSPYRWAAGDRVTIRQIGPAYVVRSESDSTKYERIPREIMGQVQPATSEEIKELEGLVGVVIEGELDGQLFPYFLQCVQNDTGFEPCGAVRRIASRIQRFSEAGLAIPPETVARSLRWYAREGQSAGA